MWWKQTQWWKSKNPPLRKFWRKRKDRGLGKGRRKPDGKDLITAPALIPALADDAPVPGNFWNLWYTIWCVIVLSLNENFRVRKHFKFALSNLSDLFPLAEGRVLGGECLLVEGVLPDVVPPAPDTDTGAPQSVGQCESFQASLNPDSFYFSSIFCILLQGAIVYIISWPCKRLWTLATHWRETFFCVLQEALSLSFILRQQLCTLWLP